MKSKSSIATNYTIVPDAYFDPQKIAEIYAFNIQESAGHLLSNYVEETSTHVLFDLHDEVYSFLTRNLWNPAFVVQPATLMRYFCNYKPEVENAIRCFVDFHPQILSVITFRGKKLLSVNSFDNGNRFEAVYFIANTCEKLLFDQNTDQIFFSGHTQENKESIEILRKLIKNTEKIQVQPKHHSPTDGANAIPTDLLIQLCES